MNPVVCRRRSQYPDQDSHSVSNAEGVKPGRFGKNNCDETLNGDGPDDQSEEELAPRGIVIVPPGYDRRGTLRDERAGKEEEQPRAGEGEKKLRQGPVYDAKRPKTPKRDYRGYQTQADEGEVDPIATAVLRCGWKTRYDSHGAERVNERERNREVLKEGHQF